MTDRSALAFVDVETTGLDPGVNRIAEIGLVTVDGTRTVEWTTLIAQAGGRARRPRGDVGSAALDTSAAPSFKDIAPELAQRLSGRLMVAHNARFDYAFLKAEFERAGIDFECDVLCSMMLSRRFYPHHARHDLDSLMQRHGLTASIRHRALPDAQLVWQFWQTIQREVAPDAIAQGVQALLSAPVLPEDLDPALIERLPEAPGVYVFHDAHDKPFHVGEARNLKLHLVDYFRLDRASTKALALAHRIKKVTWRVTQGMLGAKLHRAMLAEEVSPKKYLNDSDVYLWQLAPDEHPIVRLVSIGNAALASGNEYFGMFRSERTARGALLRLARQRYLCHASLGIPDTPGSPCLACAESARFGGCSSRAQRLKHLAKAFVALKPLRVATWPYAGAIGLRERTDVHIVDEWRYLGTARSEGEVHEVLQGAPRKFDIETYSILSATLSATPASRILDMGDAEYPCKANARESTA